MICSKEFKNTFSHTHPLKNNSKSLHKKRILVADDDDDDFDFLNTAILSLCNTVEIFRTNDGIKLSALLQTSFKFDAIIMDINMPFKNGISCLKEIRSVPELASTKVVMYSTSYISKDIDACYELGANFYLRKPTSFTAMVQQLEYLFDNIFAHPNGNSSKEDYVLDKELFNSMY